jgi:dTDP-4-dehydrorhamnose reductase
MKKIVVLGASGMLGHMVFNYLESTGNYDLIDVTYQSKLTEKSILLDAYNIEKVESFLQKTRPDILINCVGLLVSEANNKPANAIFINAYLPNFLSNILEKFDGKLIQISTDCVFSGMRGSYLEEDFMDASDIYGRSKALGEIYNNRDLTLRTSIIGPELKSKGSGLFHWFMHQNGVVNGYNNVIWSGVTTLEMAKVIEHVIEQNLVGLMHVTNGVKISKFDLLQLLKGIWNKNDLSINIYGDYSSDKSLIKSQKLNFQVASYIDMLEDLLHWMNKNKLLYKNYYSK